MLYTRKYTIRVSICSWLAPACQLHSLPLQLLGYYIKFSTDTARPPLCCVISEKNVELVSFPYYTTQGCVRRTAVSIHDSSQVPAVDALVLPELPLLDESIGFPNRHLLGLLLLLCANQGTDFYGRKDEMEVILLPCATRKLH